MTIQPDEASGRALTDDKKHLDVNERPERSPPERKGEEAPQGGTGATAEQRKRIAPGRRPLFRS